MDFNCLGSLFAVSLSAEELDDDSVPGPKKTQAAVSAAEGWLPLVDEGKYGDSWEKTADYFKKAVKPEQMEQLMNAVRKPLGRVISRSVVCTNYRTTLPGAPDGEYIMIEFSSSFENKKSAIETVTPMKEKDGRWRVSGYYIK